MTFIFSGTTAKDHFNRPLYGLHGRYTLSSGICLPYFVTAMPIERAIDELKIAEEISPSLDNRWSINELFQREVDRDRVRDQLVKGYLADPHKLKFFNALTIVLMPKSSDGTVLNSFPGNEPNGPQIPWENNDKEDAAWGAQPSVNPLNFGGVQYVVVGNQARLRWDLDRIHAVAVDGQHRLVALQVFKNEIRKKVLKTTEADTSVPVIFLIVAPAAGFTNEKGDGKQGIRAIARELFTDLNKNAKVVDTARQLVLDDWDLTARCVRTLLTDETARDSPDALPLTLVRWQEAINRFDQSYYLNSLVHLKMLVDDVLDLPTFKPMESDEVREYIKQIGHTLGEGGTLREDGSGRELAEFYKAEYCDDEDDAQTPFMRLPGAFLEAAVEGFRKQHRGWLLRVLTEFAPYRKLLTYAREQNLIEGTFGKWHAQTRDHRNALAEGFSASDLSWRKREIQDHIDAIQRIKDVDGNKQDAEWAFKTIFQKALVRLVRVVEFESKADADRLGTVSDVLTVFNGLYERGTLRVLRPLPDHDYGLWTFVATNPGNQKIKVNAKVEKNILALLRLWYFANRKLELDRREAESTAEPTLPIKTDADIDSSKSSKLVRYFETASNAPKWPGAMEAVASLKAVLKNAALFRGVAGLSADGDGPISADERKKQDDKKAKIVHDRLAALLQEGLVGATTGPKRSKP